MIGLAPFSGPIGLAEGGDMRTHYNRAMSILEKIKKTPA
jgi:hypothetical protein